MMGYESEVKIVIPFKGDGNRLISYFYKLCELAADTDDDELLSDAEVIIDSLMIIDEDSPFFKKYADKIKTSAEAVKQKPISTTASIFRNRYCAECGWPIISSCCNYEVLEFRDAADWDWWVYCSNKGCKNHDGEGILQDTPGWIKAESD